MEPAKYHVSSLKALIFETFSGIRQDEIEALCKKWIEGGNLSTVPIGSGNVMSLDEIVAYLKDNILIRFNSFEDSDLTEWNPLFSTLHPNCSWGNSADDKIYGLKEGFTAITNNFITNQGQTVHLFIPLNATRKEYRIEFWMKYSATDQAGFTENVIYLGCAATLTFGYGLPVWSWTNGANVGWARYRAIFYVDPVSGRRNLKVDQLIGSTWTNIYDTLPQWPAINLGVGDWSSHQYFEIGVNEASGNGLVGASMSAQWDGVQIHATKV